MKIGKLLIISLAALLCATLAPAFAEEVELAKVATVNINEDTALAIDVQTKAEAEAEELMVKQQDANYIADPFYPVNKAVFHFNDKMYHWFFKPVATGYKHVTPEVVRVGVSNVFSNLRSPVNMVNNLLQFKLGRFGLELTRFVINSTVGVAGIYDASYHWFDIDKQEASFGQTLGYYGVGHGPYFIWPLLGSSSLREGVGSMGDLAASPPTYAGLFLFSFWQNSCALATDRVNDTSFKLGDYELLCDCSLDPYVALRDAFVQYQKKKVAKALER